MKYVLLIFLSILSLNTFAAGGSFGGGGAGGSWDEPNKCEPEFTYCETGTSANAKCSPIKEQACKNIVRSPYSFSRVDAGVGCYAFRDGIEVFYTVLTKIENPSYNPSCKEECPAGYEKDANGKCQPKKCPVGQSLVNGQCKTKQCPVGQALDANGICMPRDDQCPAGQTMVNGRCTTSPDDPDNPDSDGDGQPDLPPFCEWASVMCQWHTEWQQWSNDYNANEEKANLDREELKRLGLDSKEQLVEINSHQQAIKDAIQNQTLTLQQVKQQDQQFYDELRLWLNNFDNSNGNPSEQYPPIQFPVFCDWSVEMCNWYLNWKDWRTDYNANSEYLKQKFDQHLLRLQEMKDQDKEHYDESKNFYDDVRDFFGWYKDQEQEPLPEPETPIQPTEPTPPEVDQEQRVNWQESCPVQETRTITLEGQTTTLEGFDMSEACSMASKMRPLILLAGALISVLIIARGHS